MPVDLVPAAKDILRVLPEICLTLVGTLLMVLEPLLKGERKKALGGIALAGLVVGLAGAVVAHAYPGSGFHGAIMVDGFATFFRCLVIVVGMLTVLSSLDYVRRESPESGEYYALLLFCVVGQCLMASAAELIVIFLGLEIASISSYILAGYLRYDERGNESAVKYFLLGSFATAFFLYGVAWIYGLTGTTNLNGIREALSAPENQAPALLVGTSAALLLVGLAFKVSAAPFQMWAADVYQGAPAPVTAFLSAGPKAAAFAIILRVYMTAFEPAGAVWEPTVWAVALATMVVGNFAAILQNNIKRMLAYSSVAHAGYVMVAVATHTQLGVAAAMFYLASYAFMNIGAFAVVTHLAGRGERHVQVEDMAGLARRQPATAWLFTIFLLSLIGIPLTGGFFGKFYVFTAAIDSGLVSLAILGLLNSAVAAYYYLRVLVVMHFHEPADGVEEVAAVPVGLQLTLWGSAVGTVVLGVFPSLLIRFVGGTSMFGQGQ